MANILGIITGKTSKVEALKAISLFYNEHKFHQIVTPNPEIILSAINDEELFYILNHSDISLADGFGLKIAALLSRQKIYRFTGADLLPYLLIEANNNQRRVVIINRSDGLSSDSDIKNYLSKNYPQIKALIISSPLKNSPSKDELKLIKDFNSTLAISLFGSPAQEKYIHSLKNLSTSISIGIGLGGAFDFLTNKAKRAPIFLRQLGLEWFWRLLMQPSKRIQRIWRATAVFMYQFLRWYYVLPHQYRANVAVLMFKETGHLREIFLLERQDEINHWQLPQGGLDGENLVKGGSRELREESGAQTFSVRGVYKNLHKYDFQDEAGTYNSLSLQRHAGYRGQRQSLLITQFLGSDDEFSLNYWDHRAWRWVREDEFIKTLHPIRRESGQLYLKKLHELTSADSR
ncbi:WecB/TagA/CpsF family glycosyltransferase [Patescibacteria group bacterium]|nr:WecB/TagA/CpsF family glycosyltransferase [Patescibacteria group bacterium]